MKKLIACLLAETILLSGCVSSTLIQSNPSGAKLYVDGTLVGSTPYTHRDTKIVGSNTDIRIVKEGYETLYTSFSRDEEVAVGPIIAGIFVWIPLLWVMKYRPMHHYELEKANRNEYSPNPSAPVGQSKAQRLRELRQLLDDKIITQEEFEAEKLKILGED